MRTTIIKLEYKSVKNFITKWKIIASNMQTSHILKHRKIPTIMNTDFEINPIREHFMEFKKLKLLIKAWKLLGKNIMIIINF